MYTGQTRSSEFHDHLKRPMSGKIQINKLLQSSDEKTLEMTPNVILSPKDIGVSKIMIPQNTGENKRKSIKLVHSRNNNLQNSKTCPSNQKERINIIEINN